MMNDHNAWSHIRFLLAVLLMCFGFAVCAQQAEVLDSGFNLNLRAEPNMDAPIITVLAPHTPLIILGRSPGDTWFQVGLVDGTIGWVKAEYVNFTNLTAPFVYDAKVQVPFEVASLVNGISENTRIIFDRGRALGNRPNVFSKVGDSITESLFTLRPVGEQLYTLGDYWYLQPVIEYYSLEVARTANSFRNNSLAAKTGWNSDTLLDPAYNDKTLCYPAESPLECEYRHTRPAIALIMIGTNDVGFLGEDLYRRNLTRIVEISITRGVIPVLSTIPPRLDRPELNQRVDRFNDIVIDTATIYQVPWLDYFSAMARLPALGLNTDGVHPNIPANGYKASADFTGDNLNYGYVIRNLTWLTALDAVWRLVIAR
jgi:hypothetical protein